MNSVQSYLDKLGRNFLVASMIPSLAFFTITMMSLQPILPAWLKSLLGEKFNPLGESGLLLLLLTIILGFSLTSLNTFIYKVFEGYVIIWRLPFLRKKEIKRSRQLKNAQTRLQNKIERLSNHLSTRAEQKRNDLVATLSAQMAEYDLEYPPTEDEILPTRFGNTLKAAETYPMSRYRIDSVPIWPRLIHVMPDDYYFKVDQVSNQLSFLMNCTILSILYAFISFGVSFYYALISISSAQRFLEISAYMLLFILAVVVGVIFMRASELVVVEYGFMIRSSYDLFRRKLLRQLELIPPATLDGEQDLWQDVCDFINIGDMQGTINFKFRPEPANQEPQLTHQSSPESDGS